MRLRLTVLSTLALLIGLAAGAARAEIRPTFGACIGEATHIVLVRIMDDSNDTFRVAESWHGDLKPGDQVRLGGLGRMAAARMVLCLKPAKGGPNTPAKWTGAGYDLRTSVVWILGEKVFAVQQPNNPGPAYVTELHWAATPGKLKEYVLRYVEDRRQFQTAKATGDLEKKIAALGKIVGAKSRYRQEAIEELGRCGPNAVDVLRKIVNGPHDHCQKYAISAMAAAGGQKALGELDAMLDEEIEYWKRTAPTLKRGWWSPGDTENKEAWIRYGNLGTLVKTLNQHGHPAARKKTETIRDFFGTQKVLEEDKRIGRMPEYCEYVLKAKKK